MRRPAQALDMPDFEHWDAEFHHRIFACSRNEFLKEIHNLMRILRNQAPWFEMKKRSFSEERRRTYCGEHQAIARRAAVARPRRRAPGDAQPSADGRSATCWGGRAMAIHEGGCHCGAIRLTYRSATPAAEHALRACQCSFCRRHGSHRRLRSRRFGRDQDRRRAKGVALPLRAGHGRLHRLPRVRRLCRSGDDRGRKVVVGGRSSTRSTTARTSPGRSTPVDFSAEDGDDRRARRRARWTPTIFALN